MTSYSWRKAHPDPFFSFLPVTISSISRLLPPGVIVSCLVRLFVSYISNPQNSLQDLPCMSDGNLALEMAHGRN